MIDELSAKQLRFEVLTSAYYHDDRENWFDFLYRWTVFGTLVLGSSAFATISSHPSYASAFAIGVTVLGSFSLVFDPAGRAKHHRDMKKQFFRIMADFERGKIDLEVAKSELQLSYSEEAAVMCAVLAMSQNRASQFVYFDDPERVELRLNFFQRLARNLIAFKMTDFHPKTI